MKKSITAATLALSGCASLQPATFAEFRQKSILAGAEAGSCVSLRELAGDTVQLREVDDDVVRFTPPPGGDVHEVEWVGGSCPKMNAALSEPGRATWQTLEQELSRLGVPPRAPWGWVQGLGAVFTTDSEDWFGTFDPETGRVGVARNDSYKKRPEHPGLLATVAQLERGLEGAIAQGDRAVAEALLGYRERWFGPSPALAKRVQDLPAGAASASVQPPAPPAPTEKDPLAAWRAAAATFEGASNKDGEALEPTLEPLHRAALAHLEGKARQAEQRGALATAAGLRLQLASLAGEVPAGPQRAAAQALIEKCVARDFVVAPPPAGASPLKLDWKVPGLGRTLATTADALAVAPGGVVDLGPAEAVEAKVTVAASTATRQERDTVAEARAAQRARMQAEIDEAKVDLAKAEAELASLQRKESGSGGGGATPYGRTDRSYDTRPDSKYTYKDTYRTSLYRSASPGGITSEMRIVGMRIDSAKSTIRIRTQELETFPSIPSTARSVSYATEEQRWSGVVRRVATITSGAFKTTLPVQVDLARYRFVKHGPSGPLAAYNGWKSEAEVLGLATSELDRQVSQELPRLLRLATEQRLAERAAADAVEGAWARHFLVEPDRALTASLELRSLADTRSRRARALAGRSSTPPWVKVVSLQAPEGRQCGPGIFSPDASLVAWCGALYDADSGQLRRDLALERTDAAQFSADGRAVAFVDTLKRRAVSSWTVETGAPLERREGAAVKPEDLLPTPASTTPAQRKRIFQVQARDDYYGLELQYAPQDRLWAYSTPQGTPVRLAVSAPRVLVQRSPALLEVHDLSALLPAQADYHLALGKVVAADAEGLHLDKGTRDGVRLFQPAQVQSRTQNFAERHRWLVTKVTETGAVVSPSEGHGLSDDFARKLVEEAPLVVVRGVDLVWD